MALGELGIIRHGGLLTEGETILRVGPTRSLEREALRLRADAIDCRGRVVMPGFVDSHTHLIFAGSRVNDYELRLRGKTYEEIAQAGGGIQSSAQKIRKAGVLSALAQQAARVSRPVRRARYDHGGSEERLRAGRRAGDENPARHSSAASGNASGFGSHAACPSCASGKLPRADPANTWTK